ncbi:hypothetical protein HJG60_008177 [Phyllostomus discolor]|uniref:Secreted protein n=1 Tax=Phyllostomus discolor TaxID=89673 RepID=A0A833ZAW8_9CHIR|nr:hypothetical protein HJG60_008177 [Phyllostomus discolor]
MWVGLCTLWDFLRTSPVRLGVSLCVPQPPWVFSISVPRLYFPALGSWVSHSALLHNSRLSGSATCHPLAGVCQLLLVHPGSTHCGLEHPGCLTRPVPTLYALCTMTQAQLPDCAPPTGLDECVYFNFLVV